MAGYGCIKSADRRIPRRRSDNSEALLTRIDELLLSGKEFSKDGLLDVLREDERWRSKPDQLDKQLTTYINQGVLRYEEKNTRGYHVKVLRKDNGRFPTQHGISH